MHAACIRLTGTAFECFKRIQTPRQVKEYVASDGFKRRVEALRAQKDNRRGIVISAGGPYYLPQVHGAAHACVYCAAVSCGCSRT